MRIALRIAGAFLTVAASVHVTAAEPVAQPSSEPAARAEHSAPPAADDRRDAIPATARIEGVGSGRSEFANAAPTATSSTAQQLPMMEMARQSCEAQYGP